MFTINIYLKFALIALFLGGGIILGFMYGFGYSAILIIIGLLLLASYVMLGTVQSAAQLVQEQEFDAAEQRLGLILNPKYLYVTNRAFYYIIKGSLAMNNKDMKLAESHFQTARGLDLPSDNERGMVLLQLANINASKNNWAAAKKYYRDAKALSITESSLKEQMTMFDQALKQSGQHKAAGSMAGKRNKGMMMRPGGKRRRPKGR